MISSFGDKDTRTLCETGASRHVRPQRSKVKKIDVFVGAFGGLLPTRNFRACVVSALALAVGFCATGCVYSYCSLESANFNRNVDTHFADGGSIALDTVWASSDSYIFYPRDFSFTTCHGDGDWFYFFVKEPLCHLPTLLIELPFVLLNRSFRTDTISVDLPDREGTGNEVSLSRILMPYRDGSVIAVTNKLDGAGHGAMMIRPVRNGDGAFTDTVDLTYRRETSEGVVEIPIGVGLSFSWIYFTSRGECYVMRRVGTWSAYNLSFCGVTIHEDYKWPIPFLWRIDLAAGTRVPIAWFDRGEIVYTLKDK